MTVDTVSSQAPERPTAGAAARTSIVRTARLAGVLYLAIFVVYPLAAAARATLVVSGDAAATVQNVAADEALFRWGMAGEATVVLVEILLAAVLYVLLRPVSRSMSLAAALARASEGVVMAASNLLTSILTLAVVGGATSLAAFPPAQRAALALLFQEGYDGAVLVWGLFFALHLLLLGWLVARSGFFPRIIGVLLVVAGVGYLAQSLGTLVAPGLGGALETVVIVLAVPGELAFALWLLVKGVDADAWHERAHGAAGARP